MHEKSLLIFLVVGIVAGWIAGVVVKGRGFGIMGDMIVGVLGAFVGGFLFHHFGLFTNGVLGLLIAAIVGAIVLLLLIRLIRSI